MKKFLKFIWVIQEKEVKHRLSNYIMRRVNPYNPLSYLVMFLTLVVGILAFGFVGVWKETDVIGDFKWS